MQKKLNKVIEIPCEESEKMHIVNRIVEHVSDNPDYINGDIVIAHARPGYVDVVLYNNCKDISAIGWGHE